MRVWLNVAIVVIYSHVSPNYKHVDSCIEDCTCKDENYFPVCGDDGHSYFSPCHAGCSIYNSTVSASYHGNQNK